MEREVAWKKYDEASLDELEALAVDYIDFISENKTERECAAGRCPHGTGKRLSQPARDHRN